MHTHPTSSIHYPSWTTHNKPRNIKHGVSTTHHALVMHHSSSHHTPQPCITHNTPYTIHNTTQIKHHPLYTTQHTSYNTQHTPHSTLHTPRTMDHTANIIHRQSYMQRSEYTPLIKHAASSHVSAIHKQHAAHTMQQSPPTHLSARSIHPTSWSMQHPWSCSILNGCNSASLLLDTPRTIYKHHAA